MDKLVISEAGVASTLDDLGGGKYYQVGSEVAIQDAIGKIFAEINAKDSTFASAAGGRNDPRCRTQVLTELPLGGPP